MIKLDILSNEYDELKNKYASNRTINKKEDLKNKLNELDYELNRVYQEYIDNNFSMTTTLEKEKNRLEKLITYIEEAKDKQDKLALSYKNVTNEKVELIHLNYIDNIKEYKHRLENINKILDIKYELKELVNNKNNKNNTRIKILKNKLKHDELLDLLYEFCLIDSLDDKDFNIVKLLEDNSVSDIKEHKVNNVKVEDTKVIVKKEPEKKIIKKEEVKPVKDEPKKIDIKFPNVEPVKEEVISNKGILTSMPIIDKIGTVSPVNVFESLKRTENKVPNVNLPSNGLTNNKEEIFINTNEYFK